MIQNSELQMDYFNRYLPNTSLIGADIRTTISQIAEWLVSGHSPYSNGIIAYPPVALVLLSPLLLIGFPGYYQLITYATLLSFVFTGLVFPAAQNKGKQNAIIYLLFALGFLSYGPQFELERGQFNLIAFAFCYAAIYIFHTHPKFRFFAYILFTISIQLKIFTLFFILLFIENWSDWKDNLQRLSLISLSNFIFLFVLGIDFAKDFFDSVFMNQLNFVPWNGNSIRSFVFRLSKTGYGIFPESFMTAAENHSTLLESILLAVFFICIIFQIIYAISSQLKGFNPYLFAACTIGALAIPTISNDYKLPLLIGPLAILFSRMRIQGQCLSENPIDYFNYDCISGFLVNFISI